jgi:hypothetical protein
MTEKFIAKDIYLFKIVAQVKDENRIEIIE